jgi:hypothetical protein
VTVPTALRHWIADAEARYAPTFEEWFPQAFDWRALCADAPRFAEQAGEAWPGATAPAARARLEDLAAAAFRGGYLATLALVSAYDAEREPEEALARLVAPVEDDEADAFATLVARDLTVAEELIGGEAPSGAPPAAAR